MATAPDLSKMSYAELKALTEQATELLDSKRTHELDVLVNGWVQKATSLGFMPSEILAMCQKFLAPKSAASKMKGDKGEYKYVNPKDKTQGYRGKGPVPAWLKAEIAKGKSKEDFAV